MNQSARIVETDGEYAVVEISRKTMCDGCHKKEEGEECSACLSFGDKSAKAKALNKIGARVGDVVEVSAKSGRIIMYSAVLFLVPIIVAFVAYFIALEKTADNATIIALTGFIVSFAVSCILLEKAAKKKPDLTVTRKIDENEN